MLEKFRLLKTKKVIAILNGDEVLGKIEDKQELGTYVIELRLPYLSGRNICDVATKFGKYIDYDGRSRWEYMYELIEHGIRFKNIATIVAYFFSETNFIEYGKEYSKLNNRERTEYYNIVINEAILKINKLLSFSGEELVLGENIAYIKSVGNEVDLSMDSIDEMGQNYIKKLSVKIDKNLESGDYDSVLTQSRTLLEEVFIYALEKRGVEANTRGNIRKLYKLVKQNYNMDQSKFEDVRVKEILSGLEKIIVAISEFRNNNGDAHGRGSKRNTIKEHHARLVANSAKSLGEFMISVINNRQ
ncbi:abortive phage infection protein [Ligilactobacillus murinus]|uniref:Abortive phage infection protein n=1 Tax=Ligilactobacillus murinus TaxID=1622 RepID=A0ABN5MA13_9LACO|nr:abortive infection family protein [Ligilactobacillus murinus]AWZ39711.1 abortive phage infection protein [Ligilactobacillus murinus]